MTTVVLLTDGVGCMDIELSEEPQLGQWSIRASLILVKIMPHNTAWCMYFALCMHVHALNLHPYLFAVA